MDQQPVFRDRVRRTWPQLCRALCALLISAIAAAPLARATDLGMAPQAAFYVTVPFQPEKAAVPEFGLRISQEPVVAGDPGFAVRRAPMLDFRLRAEREAAALGFTHAAVGAMVRSSYHADEQAHAAGVANAIG